MITITASGSVDPVTHSPGQEKLTVPFSKAIRPFLMPKIICYQPPQIFRPGMPLVSHYSDVIMSAMTFRRTSKGTSKLGGTGLCEGNPPVTGGFPSQRASNAEMRPFADVVVSIRPFSKYLKELKYSHILHPRGPKQDWPILKHRQN